ncbi:HPr kinase/phosphorylase [Novosphingobium sp.]|uniref:HPr kinase/phosphorylase n=1 Tax=Novosphingobium sp. TaxID=1874826 RepID=UPI002FDEF20A
MIAYQATAVAIGGRAVLIEGPPGSGKSSLALALIDRGAALIGDDGVMLETVGATAMARPHPNTTGLIEVRNLGLVPMTPLPKAPVALALLLDRGAPRFVESPEWVVRGGATVPMVRLWPDSPVLALRAELALRHYGLP